jgi:hypothetical protein
VSMTGMQPQQPQKGTSVDGPVESQASSGPAKYQDVWAAVLFLLHLVVMFWVALRPGLKSLRSTDAKRTQTYGTRDIARGPQGISIYATTHAQADWQGGQCCLSQSILSRLLTPVLCAIEDPLCVC